MKKKYVVFTLITFVSFLGVNSKSNLTNAIELNEEPMAIYGFSYKTNKIVHKDETIKIQTRYKNRLDSEYNDGNDDYQGVDFSSLNLEDFDLEIRINTILNSHFYQLTSEEKEKMYNGFYDDPYEKYYTVYHDFLIPANEFIGEGMVETTFSINVFLYETEETKTIFTFNLRSIFNYFEEDMIYFINHIFIGSF